MADGGDAGVRGEDARGKGDAVWVVPSTEHVPETPRIGLGDLIPLAKQLKVARAALKSFESPERTEVREKAVKDARQVLGLDSDTQVA